MRIRDAAAVDAARLTEIAWASKRHWGYADADLSRWRDELTLTPTFIERHTVRVAQSGDAIVGFHALVPLDARRIEIEHFWVAPERIGSGVGRRLFEDAVAAARNAGADALVIDSDPNAAGFYRRMGARPIGRTPAPIAGEPERSRPRLLVDLKRPL